MATKTIAWTTGSGNITLTYTGQGNGSISVSSSENDSFDDRSQSFNIITTNGSPEQAVSILVKQKGKTYPVGEVFNFAYTGSVQEITLPKGKYKFQCWGAQGGTSYGSTYAAGSKGGYSEGVITITKTTTFYVFVGGKGSRGSSSSLVNGGWNGGGAAVGYSTYSSGGTTGDSYPACGGGATDISTVTSSMSYSGGRTNRSSASLLARCIVAGGGAGGSYVASTVTTTTSSWNTVSSYSKKFVEYNWTYVAGVYIDVNLTAGTQYRLYPTSSQTITAYQIYTGGTWDWLKTSQTYTPSKSGSYRMAIWSNDTSVIGTTISFRLEQYQSTTDTTTNDYSSTDNKYGGGVSGGGQYPGTQSSAGTGGGFGYGGSNTSTNYRYVSGAGGGGWYGGGCGKSDSSVSYRNYSGGGSGFVNTSANASYRPSGYTGLQLDSGTTTAGNTSHPSTSGGTETGHSGNGYAKITVLSQ